MDISLDKHFGCLAWLKILLQNMYMYTYIKLKVVCSKEVKIFDLFIHFIQIGVLGCTQKYFI